MSGIVASIVDPVVGAHAILNASNPDLGLGSGVSGAIREACGGAAFQQEVRARLEEEFDAPLELDDCLSTGAGTADAFQWVLHVAAVNYRVRDPETGGSSGPERVFRCTRAALSEAGYLAEQHGLVGELVLAVPLLGAGHGGLSEVASADAMMRALRTSADDTAVAEVRFAVLKPETLRLLSQAAERHQLPWSRSTS